MTTQAPGIGDVGASVHTSLATWLHGIGVRQIRLITGLIMFAYIFSHFFNHALGNISYDLMETWLRYHVWWWRIPVVNDTLYLAAIVHFSLGLWALYQRRHFRYSIAEITQLVLRAEHSALARQSSGRRAGRRSSLRMATIQLRIGAVHLLGHGALQHRHTVHLADGRMDARLYRTSSGCDKIVLRLGGPDILSIAIFLPPLAMIGAHHGGREVADLADDPEWRNENLERFPTAQARVITRISLVYFPIAYGAAIGLVFIGRGLRSFRERRRGIVTISYPNRQIRVTEGLSVLEASLRHKIPHASVCGGRARCSTCRIRVVSDRSKLPQPSGREAFVLEASAFPQTPRSGLLASYDRRPTFLSFRFFRQA